MLCNCAEGLHFYFQIASLLHTTTGVTVGFSKESFIVSEDAGKGEVQVELSGEVATQVRVKVTCSKDVA